MAQKTTNAAILTVLFLLICTGCNTITSKPLENKPSKKILINSVSVIDGDTIQARIKGNKETIRLLLIDTPETNHPNLAKQPLAEEAKQFTYHQIKKAQKIELEYDQSKRDKYGRLLAYIYVDGRCLQEALLRNGLARVAYVYKPNVRYEDKFRSIQKEAQKKKAGVWQWDRYVQPNGFDTKKIPKNQLPTNTTSITTEKAY
ncbi:thermonuclease family protein [Thermoactinomyces sp. DSM 45892]|uniref:thermonuclease family protein n=1 Tax=Thermoactinomyces sp. DSM 45892 TaxID=1882753 RepID=UPI000896F012|nr:thermonuclease family protein [Thermoactinomyces sp. DSM 45892]SDY13217.1 micrococcal nuclease [Thermoactinomyces sp. DSM 45892]